MYTTLNSLSNKTRKDIATILQARLSDALDLASQAKQAHWNVKGPNFVGLHELFDKLYAEFNDHGDMIAERLTALGGQAWGTVEAVSVNSGLTRYPLDISAQEDHLEALAKVMGEYCKMVRASSDEVSKIGDEATADLFIEILRAAEKSLWLVEAHRTPAFKQNEQPIPFSRAI